MKRALNYANELSLGSRPRKPAVALVAVLATCGLLLTAATGNGQEFMWESAGGPYGGNAEALLVASDGVLYAGTDGAGVFRSTDDGASWAQTALTRISVTSFAEMGTRIFAGTIGGGVFRSDDGGNSWQAMNHELTSIVQTVGFRPPDVLALTVWGGSLYVSTRDNIGGVPTGGVFRSDNRGNSWTSTKATLFLLGGWSASLVGFGDALYMATSEGVFRRQLGGGSWGPAGMGGLQVESLAASSNRLFAGTPSGVFSSSDGLSWRQHGLQSHLISTLFMSDTTLYAASHDSGVFRSEGAGVSWLGSSAGMSNTDVHSLALSGTRLYAGTKGGGVFRSQDRGGSWTDANTGLAAVDIWSLASSDGVLYAGTGGHGVFRSDDGLSWTSAGLTGSVVSGIAVSGTEIYAATFGQAVQRSSDGGASWTLANAGLVNPIVTSVLPVGNTLYAGTFGDGVFRSVNRGNSWTRTGPGGQIVAWSLAASETAVYCGTAGDGVFRSTDGGNRWSPVNSGLTSRSISSLEVVGAAVYAGTFATNAQEDAGVFRLSDGGASWTPVNAGLTDPDFPRLEAMGTTLYVGTIDGVFSLVDGSNTWTPVGLEGRAVYDLAVADGILYAGASGGGGVFRLSRNLPPLAVAQGANTPEDTEIILTLLAEDPDGDPLSFQVTTGPQHGEVVLAGELATFMPEPDYSGEDQFAFIASDGTMDSRPAAVTITVQAVNDPPTVEPLAKVTAEDTPVTLTLRSEDVDGDSLTFTLKTSPTNGTAALVDNTVAYVPAEDFHGDDHFTYVANDGTVDSAPATIAITVTPVNDDPTGGALVETTAEDTPITFALVGDDVDGDALTYAVDDGPTDGELSIVGDSATYTPSPEFSGPDSFTYTVSDGTVTSVPVAVSITVTPESDLPAAVAATRQVDEDTSVTFALAGTDPDGDPLTFRLDVLPTHGEAVLVAESVTYTPHADFSGADSFTYIVNDGESDSDPATVNITVTNVADGPVAAADTVVLQEDEEATVVLTATDADGDALTYRIETGPSHGTATLSAETVTYTPAPDFHGSDSFGFVADDSSVASDLATITITVTPVNDPPIAQPQSVVVDASGEFQVELVATDVDNESLVYSVVTHPAHGTAVVDGSTATYVPEAGYSGADAFTFAAEDETTSSDAATISIEVVPAEPWDVDGSGTVDIVDLVTVASAFGSVGPDIAADVNDDGRVDIVDLVTIARHFGEAVGGAAAAPRLPSADDAPLLDSWIREARRSGPRTYEFRQGILVLERLLGSVIPSETVVLANYPNPFNPETWIPFRLSESADVNVRIFTMSGHVIRRLRLGRLPAGVYEARSRAAYWDGRTEAGDPAASGMYMYELSANGYRAVKRMTILK
jgi:hypothetical protein